MSDTKAFQSPATEEVTLFSPRPWQHSSFPEALITRVTTLTTANGNGGVFGGEGLGQLLLRVGGAITRVQAPSQRGQLKIALSQLGSCL